MRSLKLSLLSLSLVAGLSSTAAAQQVNFDDLTSIHFGMVPSPYAGFTWSNAYVMNVPVVYGTGVAGFSSALSSGDRVVLNGGGAAMSISGSSFNLLSGTFAAAWTNGLSLNVKGFSGGDQLYDQDYTLDWSTASTLELNLFGIDHVIFSSSGGTVDEAFAWDSNQSFAADDLEFGYRVTNERRMYDDGDIGLAVVPEPMTVSLMAAGLLVLGGVQTRRRRLAAKQ